MVKYDYINYPEVGDRANQRKSIFLETFFFGKPVLCSCPNFRWLVLVFDLVHEKYFNQYSSRLQDLLCLRFEHTRGAWNIELSQQVVTTEVSGFYGIYLPTSLSIKACLLL